MKPQIVFFGTGPVSLATLEGIVGHFDIEAIITKPDREMHGKPHNHPVKAWGNDHGIPVYQVAGKAELSDLFSDRPFSSKLGLVVDFGIIIAQDVIDYFSLGILNSHFSLLPLLRGADPISFAVLEGMPVTGVSIMIIVPQLDAGDLLVQEEYRMPPDITTPELTHHLTLLSNQMLLKTVPRYIAGDVILVPQNPNTSPTFSRKLTREDGIIDWAKPAAQIEREIRAFIGWPGSHTTLFGRDVIITAAHVGSNPDKGSTLRANWIKCGDQKYLIIDRLKPVGKNDMAAVDFLRGIKT